MVRASGRKHVLLNVHWDRILKVPTYYLLPTIPLPACTCDEENRATANSPTGSGSGNLITTQGLSPRRSREPQYMSMYNTLRQNRRSRSPPPRGHGPAAGGPGPGPEPGSGPRPASFGESHQLEQASGEPQANANNMNKMDLDIDLIDKVEESMPMADRELGEYQPEELPHVPHASPILSSSSSSSSSVSSIDIPTPSQSQSQSQFRRGRPLFSLRRPPPFSPYPPPPPSPASPRPRDLDLPTLFPDLEPKPEPVETGTRMEMEVEREREGYGMDGSLPDLAWTLYVPPSSSLPPSGEGGDDEAGQEGQEGQAGQQNQEDQQNQKSQVDQNGENPRQEKGKGKETEAEETTTCTPQRRHDPECWYCTAPPGFGYRVTASRAIQICNGRKPYGRSKRQRGRYQNQYQDDFIEILI